MCFGNREAAASGVELRRDAKKYHEEKSSHYNYNNFTSAPSLYFREPHGVPMFEKYALILSSLHIHWGRLGIFRWFTEWKNDTSVSTQCPNRENVPLI